MKRDKTKSHFKIETNAKNVKFLHSNGLVKKSIRPGNLGAEAANQYLNSYGWHRSAAGLRTWYIRSDIWFLSVNINKYYFWQTYLMQEQPHIYNELEKVVKKVDHLEYYKDYKTQHGSNIVPSIPLYVKEKSKRGNHLEDIDKIINDRIKTDKLKFKDPFENPKKWGTSELYTILEAKQDPKWQLNDKTLEELFIKFERRRDKQSIKTFCSKNGINFHE